MELPRITGELKIKFTIEIEIFGAVIYWIGRVECHSIYNNV